jgi:hypothetical protein
MRSAPWRTSQPALEVATGVQQIGGRAGGLLGAPVSTVGQAALQRVAQPLGQLPDPLEAGQAAMQPDQSGLHLGHAVEQLLDLGDVGAQHARLLGGERAGAGRLAGGGRGRVQRGDPTIDLVDEGEHLVDAGARQGTAGLAMGCERVLQRVGVVRDLALPDHPGRALERVSQAQEVGDARRRRRLLLEREHCLSDLDDQLARLDAEVLVRILAHAWATAWTICSSLLAGTRPADAGRDLLDQGWHSEQDAAAAARQLDELAHRLRTGDRAGLGHDRVARDDHVAFELVEGQPDLAAAGQHQPARRSRGRVAEQEPQVVDRDDGAAQADHAEQLG